MKQFWTRLTAETPSFFKKIRTAGISLTVIGGGIKTIPDVPDALLSMSSEFIWIGFVAALIAGTVVKDPEVLNKNQQP